MDKTKGYGTGVMFLETEKEWLTLEECADFFRVHKNTIIRWRNKKRNFPQPKRPSSRITFYSSTLVREWFLKEEEENND